MCSSGNAMQVLAENLFLFEMATTLLSPPGAFEILNSGKEMKTARVKPAELKAVSRSPVVM
jgi:hypothetical protein